MHVKDPICRFRKSMPICSFGAATDGKMSAPIQLSPFPGHGMSKIIFPVFHPYRDVSLPIVTKHDARDPTLNLIENYNNIHHSFKY
jgi:hypothetical protein